MGGQQVMLFFKGIEFLLLGNSTRKNVVPDNDEK